MTYERDLAFNLCLRGVPESKIAEAIGEVEAHTMSAGVSPEVEFGTPEEYASTFPASKPRIRGVRVMIVAAVLNIAYVAAVFTLKALATSALRVSPDRSCSGPPSPFSEQGSSPGS